MASNEVLDVDKNALLDQLCNIFLKKSICQLEHLCVDNNCVSTSRCLFRDIAPVPIP